MRRPGNGRRRPGTGRTRSAPVLRLSMNRAVAPRRTSRSGCCGPTVKTQDRRTDRGSARGYLALSTLASAQEPHTLPADDDRLTRPLQARVAAVYDGRATRFAGCRAGATALTG